MLHIDFSNKRTLTSSVVYKQNEIDNKGVSAKLINVDIDENSSGAAFWTSPSGETMQTEFVINGEIGTFKVPTSEVGTWILELVVYNDGRPKSADYNFEILKSYSVDPSNAEIELLIETIVRHDHTYTQNENIRIENENTRVIEHNDRMNKSDVATANAIQATHNADQATANANEATQRANDSAENAEHAIENMVQLTGATVTATANANAQAEYAKLQGDYAKTQGDHAKQATIDASNATSLTNQAIQSANTATTNAVNATNNTVTATDRANTATQQANAATANANTATTATIQATTEARSATTNAIQATNNAQTATTNANTATANANNATVNANTATTNANTATTKANQAVTSVQNAIAAGTVDLETKQARTDATGFVHANLKTRLDEDFKELASKIPTDISVNGYESVTTNDTVSGEVSSAVLTGQTLVNVFDKKLLNGGSFSLLSDGFFKKANNNVPFDIIQTSVDLYKPNTKYTFVVESKDNTLSADLNVVVSDTCIFTSYSLTNIIVSGTNTSRVFTAQTRADTSNISRVFWFAVSGAVTGTAKFRILILEGDHTNKSLEFFEGLKSAEVAEIRTKNVDNTKSSKTTFAPIKLRSLPNGISDTYDVDTGVLTRRCGEVVLNGSESGWSIVSQSVETGFVKFKNLISTITTVTSSSKNDFAINDKFQHVSLGEVMSNFGGNPFTTGSPTKEFFAKHNNANEIVISIAKSKLATPDVAGFKAWLAQNPTTVVYQLATPTTEYIENNGQLRSYDSQTTVFANSVVPVKISGNIPVNYASTLANLATQARNLQIENTALIEQAESLSEQLNIAEQTNNFQDELIDVSLMATDELYVMLEPLLAQPMMSSKNTQDSSQDTTKNTRNVSDETTKQTQGGNAMVDAYVAMVIRGLKTIDEVPARYREEVRRILAELDK